MMMVNFIGSRSFRYALTKASTMQINGYRSLSSFAVLHFPNRMQPKEMHGHSCRWLSSSSSPRKDDKDEKNNSDIEEGKEKDNDKSKKDEPLLDEGQTQIPHNTVTEEESEYLRDLELQNSFDSFFGRTRALLNFILFRDEKAMEIYKSVTEKHKLVSPNSIEAMKLMRYLLNPLLIKYKFDIGEFAEGVNLAYPVVREAISMVRDSVAYPQNYASRRQEVKEKRLFLQEILGGRAPKQLEGSLKEAELFKQITQMKSFLPSRLAMNVTVSGFSIDEIRTRIVERDNTGAHQETAKGPVLEISEQLEPFTPMMHAMPSLIKIDQRKEDLRRYRPGAVIATVTVAVLSTGSLSHTSGLDKSEELKERELGLDVWDFEACISGHSPINWIVTQIGTIPDAMIE
jgi:hypothetical protein